MKHSFFYDTVTISFQSWGKGTPVLLLHGFGEDSAVLLETAEQLAQNYQVILPDLPGSGESEFSADLASSIDKMGEAMLALMEAQTNAPFFCLGHSMGGYIALAMAEMQPQQILGFGLLHSTAFADNDEKKQSRKQAINVIQEKGSHTFLKTAIPGLFSDDFKAKHPEVIDGLIEKGKAFTPEALVAYYTAIMNRPDRSNLLKEATQPVLIVMGEYDKAAPKADLLKQAAMPAVCAAYLLQQTAHMGFFEEKQAFNQAIQEYLNNFANPTE